MRRVRTAHRSGAVDVRSALGRLRRLRRQAAQGVLSHWDRFQGLGVLPDRLPRQVLDLGLSRIIGPCAAGSLQSEAAPGHFVICDQLVDRTSGRADTFYDGPVTTHVAFADPYCPELRGLALKQAQGLGITAHDGGTMVVVQGPRFSTRAESRWYQEAGWKVINMTGYPEALLARELEICYVNVSLITDYDVGLEGAPGVEPVSHAEVVRVFEQNNAKLRDLLFALIPTIPAERSCICASALSGASFEV